MRHVVEQPEPSARALSEPVLWILLSLAAQPRHGYALMQDVRALSEGRVRLATGTLYGALSRMLGDGWIAPVDLRDTSRDKQAYRLTGLGLSRLRAETERLRRVARAATGRLRALEA